MNQRYSNGGFRADRPLSLAKVENVAGRLRQRLGLGVLDRLPQADLLFEKLEGLEVGRRRIPLSTEVKDLPAEALAFTEYEPGSCRIIVGVSDETYEMLEDDMPRGRFSVCHELAHAEEHTDLLIRLQRLPHRKGQLFRDSAPPHKAYWDTEWQANSIAAALLMPAQGVLQAAQENPMWPEEAIMEAFGASREAAEIRLSKVLAQRN